MKTKKDKENNENEKDILINKLSVKIQTQANRLYDLQKYNQICENYIKLINPSIKLPLNLSDLKTNNVTLNVNHSQNKENTSNSLNFQIKSKENENLKTEINILNGKISELNNVNEDLTKKYNDLKNLYNKFKENEFIKSGIIDKQRQVHSKFESPGIKSIKNISNSHSYDGGLFKDHNKINNENDNKKTKNYINQFNDNIDNTDYNDYKEYINKNRSNNQTHEIEEIKTELNNQIIINEEQKNYIELLKQAIESNLIKHGYISIDNKPKSNQSLLDMFINGSILNTEIENHKNHIINLNNEITLLNKENSSLTRQINQIDDEKNRIFKEKSGLSEKMNNLNSLLKVKENHIDELAHEKDSLLKLNQDLTEKIKIFKESEFLISTDNERLINQVNDMKNQYNNEIYMLNDTNRRLSNENLYIKSLLDRNEKENQELNNEINSISDLKFHIKELKIKENEYNKEINSLVSEIYSYKSELNMIKSDLYTVISKNEGLIQKNISLSYENDSYNVNINELKEINTILINENNKLKQELSDSNQKNYKNIEMTYKSGNEQKDLKYLNNENENFYSNSNVFFLLTNLKTLSNTCIKKINNKENIEFEVIKIISDLNTLSEMINNQQSVQNKESNDLIISLKNDNKKLIHEIKRLNLLYSNENKENDTEMSVFYKQCVEMYDEIVRLSYINSPEILEIIKNMKDILLNIVNDELTKKNYSNENESNNNKNDRILRTSISNIDMRINSNRELYQSYLEAYKRMVISQKK